MSSIARRSLIAAWRLLAHGAAVLALAGLAGCGESLAPAPPVEVMVAGPLELAIDVQGELRSAKATPLVVPGTQFARRQLISMVDEGSLVQAGDTIARFAARQGELDLKDARVNLLRNALARTAKESELAGSGARIDADLAQVDTDLAIAERYAHADLDYFARNQLLDALQDRQFLGEKQGFLGWKRAQTGERGAAELAVLDSQRQSQAQNAKMREADLAALELIAPHAGVLMLSKDWSGEKPRVGASLWAGNDFGSLPDPSTMEVQFALTQLDASGIKLGAAVELYPLGQPQSRFLTKVEWVAAAAQPISRQNPIKYLRMKASVPSDIVQQLQLVPGQTLSARLYAVRAPSGLSVPNVALVSTGADSAVELWQDGQRVRRNVRLGERGLARSQVLEGLSEGDVVVLTPEREARS